MNDQQFIDKCNSLGVLVHAIKPKLVLCDLDNINGQQLAGLISSIPSEFTKLDLSGNNLGNKTGAELALAFAAIPAGVTTLDLGGNNLEDKTGEELAQVFAAIPPGVTTLYLGNNYLGFMNGEEFAQVFAAIPHGVTTLYLGNNYLSRRTGAELARALAAIPAGVTTLYLGFNGLGYKIGAELALAFAAIPPGVTTLYLFNNNLGNMTGAELALAFAAIPRRVTTLNLSWNGLGNKTGEELARALAAIPAGVTTLNLGFNDLGNKTGEELALAFAAIPPGVGTIGLSSSELDGLLKEKSIHGFLAFFENFPNSVKSLMVGGEIYTPPSAYLFSMSESRFETLYEDYVLPLEDDAGMMSYQSIKPLVPIDENTLLELIEVLGKYPSPQTDLICALLLEGRIENDVAAEKMEQMDYTTQRRLYALDFFQRAACNADETVANQIEMIMMHVKNTEPEDSPIHEKLSKFIFTPEKKFEEGDDENKSSFTEKSDTLPSIDLNGLRALLGAKPPNPHVFFSQDKAAPDSTNEPNLKKP